jgi:hypothetical protein
MTGSGLRRCGAYRRERRLSLFALILVLGVLALAAAGSSGGL